jgi:hypothetical protein
MFLLVAGFAGRPPAATPDATALPPDLALVPGDALAFGRVPVAAAWNHASMKLIREQLQKGDKVADIEKFLGIGLNDLDHLTVLILPGGQQDAEPIVVGVLTTSRPIDWQKVVAAFAPSSEEKTHKTKKYHAARDGRGPAIHRAADRMLLLADEPMLKKFWDRPSVPVQPGRLAEVLKLASAKDRGVATMRLPPALAQRFKQQPLPAPFDFARPLVGMESVTAVLDFGPHSKTEVTILMPDEAAAARALAALKQGQAFLKEQLAGIPAHVRQDPLAGAALKEADSAVSSATMVQEKATIRVQLNTNTAVLAGLVLPAMQKTRVGAQRMQSANNLKQLALAMHNYNATHGHLPPDAIRDGASKALLSWRVAILPYIEQEELYKEFKLDEPWDSEHNKKLIARMPPLFAPLNAKPKDPHSTFYQVLTGPTTVFEGPGGAKFQDIVDGTSNTLLIVEAAEAAPWTKPADVSYDPNKAAPKLGGVEFPDGFWGAFCDGSVRFLRKDLDERTLRGLITRNGGEVINP